MEHGVYRFGKAFLDGLKATEGQWTEVDGHMVRSTQNTAIVLRVLREAASKEGFIPMLMLLTMCETEQEPVMMDRR